MPSQNDSGGRGSPRGSAARPRSDFEDLVRQGQDQLKQINTGKKHGGYRGSCAGALYCTAMGTVVRAANVRSSFGLET